MAEEVEMTPVAAAEPPKADPLAKPAAPKAPTIGQAPLAKPIVGKNPTAVLKPGLKLPPQGGLRAGIKLPPKPGATVSTLRPGLKLPTQTALKPGIKLPPKPVIRKPGATVTAAPLPKPVVPAAANAAAPAEAKPAAPVAVASTPAPAVAKPVAPVAEKPVAVDAQGVGKLPTVEAKAVARDDATPVVSNNPKPLEALKTVTQKLKGITQEIPQQAILRKTGIIADSAMSEAQKEAAKHKTARISLSDAMGVAPVKNEAAPMKTIRIKRPIGIPGATGALKPPADVSAASAEKQPAAENPAEETSSTASITQRKTLKIARPHAGAVRPAGKFGVKRPSQATTVVQKSAGDASGESASAGDAPIADIPDIPPMPMSPVQAAAPSSDGPAWLWAISSLVQIAACVAMGALAWFLYQNTQVSYF